MTVVREHQRRTLRGSRGSRRRPARAFELMSSGWFGTERESLTSAILSSSYWATCPDSRTPRAAANPRHRIFRVRDGLVAEKLSYVKS